MAAHKADFSKIREDNESLQAKYYARPVSYLLAWVFIRIGWTANSVSVLAFVVGVAGCLFVADGGYWSVVGGAILLNLRHVLDYADGTVARATGTASNYGAYIDRLLDEIMGVMMPLAIGIGLLEATGLTLWLDVGIIYALLTALSAISIAQVGLVYKNTAHKFYAPKKRGLWALVYSVGTNLQSMSTIMLLPAAVFMVVEWYLIFYTILTACEFILAVVLGVLRREDE